MASAKDHCCAQKDQHPVLLTHFSSVDIWKGSPGMDPIIHSRWDINATLRQG
jgi:hypothetical protein